MKKSKRPTTAQWERLSKWLDDRFKETKRSREMKMIPVFPKIITECRLILAEHADWYWLIAEDVFHAVEAMDYMAARKGVTPLFLVELGDDKYAWCPA